MNVPQRSRSAPPEGANAAGASLRSGAARARTSGGDDWEAKAFNQGVLCLEAVQIELPHPHTGEPLAVRADSRERKGSRVVSTDLLAL